MFPTRFSPTRFSPTRFSRTLVAISVATCLGWLTSCGTTDDNGAVRLEPLSSIPAELVVAGGAAAPEVQDGSSGPSVAPHPDSEPTQEETDEGDDSTGFPDQGPVQPQPAGDDSGHGGGSTSLDPVPLPTGPCVAWVPGGASLVVGPDPQVLEPGAMTATISITNCGDSAIDWTGKTVATVNLDSSGTSLVAGDSAVVTATIHDDSVGPGAVEVKVKISEPGHNHYVDIHAYDPLVGSDIVAGGGNLSPGADAMGCALQCISKALLRPNMTNANVSLDVVATVPAEFQVWVSTDESVVDDEVPSFPGESPTASSNEASQSWTASLAPLEASTTYNIIVAATDANGHTAYRVGHFTTRTPVDLPDGLADAGGDSGCATQCITSAVVSTHDDGTADLVVASHTPATFQVFVSLDAPQYDGPVPAFDETVAWAASGLAYSNGWDTVLADLVPDTTHHIIVMATDADGRSSYQVGQFHTPEAPFTTVLIGMHQLLVVDDGDGVWNWGEISTAWGVQDGGSMITVGTQGESKYDAGMSIELDDTETFWPVQVGAGGFLPTVYLNVFERDADAKIEWCEPDTDVHTTSGASGSCDLTWGVGSTGLVSVAGLMSFPLCSDVGLGLVTSATARCTAIATDGGEATLSAVVSFDVV